MELHILLDTALVVCFEEWMSNGGKCVLYQLAGNKVDSEKTPSAGVCILLKCALFMCRTVTDL